MKKFLLLLLMVAYLVNQQCALAQALPVTPAANFVVNRAVAGVITKVALSRGFAANDPRILATMAGVGQSLTAANVASTVAGVGLAVAGAPVWLTVAGSLGVLALGAAIVAGSTSISIDTAAGKLKVTQPPPTAPDTASPYSHQTAWYPYVFDPLDPTAIFNPSSDYFFNPFQGFINTNTHIYRGSNCFSSQTCFAYDPMPSGIDVPYKIEYTDPNGQGTIIATYWSLDELKNKLLINNPFYTPGAINIPQLLSASTPAPDLVMSNNTVTVTDEWHWVTGPSLEISPNGTKRLVGSYSYGRTCTAGECYVLNPGSLYSNTYQWTSQQSNIVIGSSEAFDSYDNLDAALPFMSSSMKSQQLSPDVLAKMVDKTWQNAASQPGYEGLPYSVTNPVTSSDVQAWQLENPQAVPTLGDMLLPANNPGSATVLVTNGSTSTTNPDASGTSNVNVVNTPNVNVVNTVSVDLGPNPNVGQPGLESTPTALSILQPILDLFPDLKSFTVPQHTGECPKPSFNIWNKDFTLDSHCTLAEQNRGAIAAMMGLVFALSALFIVLRA